MKISSARIAAWAGVALCLLVLIGFLPLKRGDSEAGKGAAAVVRGPEVRTQNRIRSSERTHDQPSVPDLSGATERLVMLARSKLAHWMSETNEVRRMHLEAELRALLTDKTAATLVRGLSPDLLDNFLGELSLQRWASLERRAAADWMARLTNATDFQAGLVMYGWLAEDREAMFAYIDQLPDGTPWKRAVLFTASNDALLAKDGAEAINLLGRLPQETQRDAMLGWAATEWAMKTPEAAAKWAGTITDDRFAEEMRGSISVGFAWIDPRAAAEFLIKSVESEPVLNQSIESIVSIWTQNETPASVAEWIQRFPAGNVRVGAIRTLMNNWAYDHPDHAKTWVENLPEKSEVRREAEFQLKIAFARMDGIEATEEHPEGVPETQTR